MKRMILLCIACFYASLLQHTTACTGITLHTSSHSPVPARTIEWAGNDLESCYTIVPRGYRQCAMVPGGAKQGKCFTAKYGYIGLAVERAEFVVEGLNEAGLSAGLFYFPAYGQYETYKPSNRANTLSDLQLVSWVLSSFKTIEEIQQAIKHVHIVSVDPRGSTVHWRFTEESGRQVILEITQQEVHFYENPLGVFTNSPGFEWHLTNLNNYVNLQAGAVQARSIGTLHLKAFGGGSGMLGIPGDMTPPSRFVRAAFFQATAPQKQTGEETVLQAFHILNNFDIPVGIQFADKDSIPNIPSATQWTVATDIGNRRIYYRTMHDSSIRCFDLKAIDFNTVSYQSAPLDPTKKQPIVMMLPQL